MFKQVHLRLTLLFTIVTALILTGMSILFLYFNTKSLYKSAMLQFQNNLHIFSAGFEDSIMVSYDRLFELQNNYSYDFYLYDNAVPLRFTQETKTQTQKLLINDIYAEWHAGSTNRADIDKIMQQEFTYRAEQGKFLVGVLTIPGEQSDSEIFVLYSLQGVADQLHQLYLQFAVIILFAVSILLLFSWFYTRHLLRPIQESQVKQTQFIAAASHEIRNPVNTILSALSAMKKGTPEQQKEFSAIAAKEGKRLRLLTDDLLLLARSDSHSFPMTPGDVELDTIVLDCYEAFTAPAREKKIHLSVELPEDAILAKHIDAERIRQVAAILLDNAISYTPSGGIVQIRCWETAKNYCLAVADNGIGISDKEKKSIFDRFYRADISRASKEHFGLGLCIAKEIVTFHCGSIIVKDTPGGGATFLVRLPKINKSSFE